MQIKDANGKEISFDVSKICDINGDLGDGTSTSVTDSRSRNRVHQVHDIEYVDQNGQALDAMQVLADMASGKTNVVALDVEMEATHSGKNHNYCIYYEDSMEKDSESFVNPFRKPMLKNHNDYSGEPLGRIIQSTYGPSQLTDERSAIHLKARVTDQDAIPKFLDGRYGTVSIGGSMGTVTCNVCGKTILKDGKFNFCGHWRGETYKDQVCYWGARDIEYHEVSTVNNPADDYAQIMKVTVITDSDKEKDNKEGKDMGGQQDANNNKDNVTADAVKKSLCDIIDQILGSDTPATETPAATDTADSGSEETAQDGQQSAEQGNATDNNEVENLQTQLADANAKIEKLEKDLADAQAATNEANQKLTDATQENQDLQDKCMALATANKELVADSVIKQEIEKNILQEDNKDARKQELIALSMKDLNKVAEEVAAKDAAPRTPVQVENPTLANPEKDEVTDSNGTADTDKSTNNTKAKTTVDDFANDIVGKLFNK